MTPKPTPALVEFIGLDMWGRAIVRNVSGRQIERGEFLVIAPTADKPQVVEPPQVKKCRWTGCTSDASELNTYQFCPSHAARVEICTSPGCPAVIPAGAGFCTTCRGARRDFYPHGIDAESAERARMAQRIDAAENP